MYNQDTHIQDWCTGHLSWIWVSWFFISHEVYVWMQILPWLNSTAECSSSRLTTMDCPCSMYEVVGFKKSRGSSGTAFPSSAAWALIMDETSWLHHDYIISPFHPRIRFCNHASYRNQIQKPIGNHLVTTQKPNGNQIETKMETKWKPSCNHASCRNQIQKPKWKPCCNHAETRYRNQIETKMETKWKPNRN